MTTWRKESENYFTSSFGLQNSVIKNLLLLIVKINPEGWFFEKVSMDVILQKCSRLFSGYYNQN